MQVLFARQELEKRSLAVSLLKLSICPLVVLKEVYVDVSTYLFNKRQMEILQSMFSPVRGSVIVSGSFKTTPHTPVLTPRDQRSRQQVQRYISGSIAMNCQAVQLTYLYNARS